MVRVVVCLTLATAILGVGAASAAQRVGLTSQALARQRAIETFDLMQQYFYDGATRSWGGTYPVSGNGYAQVWPTSQVYQAIVGLARLPGEVGRLARARLAGERAILEPYRVDARRGVAFAPIYGGFGNLFYDDNVWIGLEFDESSSLLHDPGALTEAEQVFAWLRTGWDTSAEVCRGGIYWLQPGGSYWDHSPENRYRTAVSTLNTALLGVELYEQTDSRSDLRFAERAYDWTNRCLARPSGLIADHIDANGRVFGAIHSYNQGAMVATAVNLYRVTGDRAYLSAALRTARAALAVFRNAQGTREPASFLAIFYGDLAPLAQITGDRMIRAQLESFANRAWFDQRDPATGLFHFGHTDATLLDQSAMVQIYAQLASM